MINQGMRYFLSRRDSSAYIESEFIHISALISMLSDSLLIQTQNHVSLTCSLFGRNFMKNRCASHYPRQGAFLLVITTAMLKSNFHIVRLLKIPAINIKLRQWFNLRLAEQNDALIDLRYVSFVLRELDNLSFSGFDDFIVFSTAQ